MKGESMKGVILIFAVLLFVGCAAGMLLDSSNSVTPADWFFLIIAIAVTIYVASAENLFEKGTDEYHALRICRVGLALLVWSLNFGIIGFSLALASFILGIVGIVKGRGLYGTMLIVGSVVLPIISILNITYKNV